MEKITGFSMKKSLSAFGLGWKYLNSLRSEEDVPFYTYNDKYMRWFLRQSLREARVYAYNQYNRSKVCDYVLKTISEELNVKRNVHDFIEAYMKYKNKHYDMIKKEYESKFDDHSEIDQDGMDNHKDKKLGELPIHKLLQELGLKDLLWDFDAVSSSPSAMSDPESIYPRIETGYVFTPDMNGELVEKINSGNYTQGSAILKLKYYKPKTLIVQHLPIKERVNKIEINRMLKGCIVDVSTSVAIQEIGKIGGKVFEIFEAVICKEKFKISPF